MCCATYEDYKIMNNLKRVVLIDLRDRKDYRKLHIFGSVNIPYDTLMKDIKKYLNHTYLYYLVCQSGIVSKNASLELIKLGYHVESIDGGIDNWPDNSFKIFE